MSHVNFDVDYFIKKFNAIPESDIGVGLSERCALWHCGVRLIENVKGGYSGTEESAALIKLFGGFRRTDFHAVYSINDIGPIGQQTLTPKQRILNKLYQIKDGINMAQ